MEKEIKLYDKLETLKKTNFIHFLEKTQINNLVNIFLIAKLKKNKHIISLFENEIKEENKKI